MDLTRTCPTCGHIDDASSRTCSFCGVELGRHSENLPNTGGTDASAGDENRIGQQAGENRTELPSEAVHPQKKPDSLDAAVAHVLAAEPVVDLLEVVDLDEEVTSAGEAASLPGVTPRQGEPESNPVGPEQVIKDESNEAVILPESVQLKSAETAAPAQEGRNRRPSEGAAAPKAPDAKAEQLMQHRAALAKAEALKKRKLALAKAAALKQKRATQNQVPAAVANIRLQKLLRQYLGKTIGINFDNSAVIEAAELLSVNAEYLSVFVKSKKLRYHFPLTTILSIIESVDGNGVPTGADNEVFNAVVKIYPLVLF